MTETLVADLFQVQNRFLRSAHLERDFVDPKAIKGYVLTPQVQGYLHQLANGLTSNSGRRAWRVTGDFGVGKSSFALVIAHLFSERNTKLPPALRGAVNFKEVGLNRPRLLPVLITGSREPLSIALLRSLHRDLQNTIGRGRPPAVIEKIRVALSSATEAGIIDDTVLKLISEANSYVSSSGKATGLLIILDELGKFLEFAALNPDKQDVFLLQRLAEIAARSGRTPLFIVGLLHQGFGAYADRLSQSAQREWEKVAGRFDELLFDQPLEQTAGLVGDALNIRLTSVPKVASACARADMISTIKLGWYGAPAIRENLLENAARLYPLHPTVLPSLVQIFGRFGQNQRSLFSFLMSDEPFGLLEFAQAPVSAGHFYRLHHLYDYARSTFGHRLSVQSYRSHWNLIESIIESYPTDDIVELRVLKTVGLLNLIDANSLLATEEAIVIAVAGDTEEISAQQVRRAVKKLHTIKHVLYHRGAAGGFCLWSHTSVNIERAYELAVRTLGQSLPQRVSPLIQSYLETRPLVARRHYIETGNLRHFEVVFSPVENLAESVNFSYDSADGRIVVALCETAEEHQDALRFATSGALEHLPEVLLAVPSPLGVLGKLFQEVQRWEWVSANTEELNNDSYAREEVSRQLIEARQALDKSVKSLIGLQQSVDSNGLSWFKSGLRLDVKNNRDLLERLSRICDEVYDLAPRVHNELINRRAPSAAANGARTRLLEGIFGAQSEPYLGMDPVKKPPEMAIYLSLLQEGGIHQQVGDAYALLAPDVQQDKCNLLPSLERIGKILEAGADSRIKVSDLMADLRRPPYGIRDGLSPILIALFAVLNEQHIAFYDNGAFMREMMGLDILRLTKVPEVFEVQYCKVAGVRSELYKRLLSVLGEQTSDTSIAKVSTHGRKTDVLDVVRPLCVFAAHLPQFTRKTNRLSATALAVRSTLLNAREPSTLLFRELPVACGFPVINVDTSQEVVEGLVETLKEALDELRRAFLILHERMATSLAENLGVPGNSSGGVRASLAARAKNILSDVKEPQLKAFCLRLADNGLAEAEWLDSIGSLACSVPPQKWTDIDTEKFVQELGTLASKFKRVESIAFQDRRRAKNQQAVRIAITRLDGSEVDDVIYVSQDEEDAIARVEAQITKILTRTKRIGMAGTARAFWKMLASNGEKAGSRDA